MSGLMIKFNAKSKKDKVKTPNKIRVETRVETGVEMRVENNLKTPDLILKILKIKPDMTLSEVAENIGRGLSTVERVASKMVKDGRLCRIGAKKGGYWKVIEKGNR
jgi:predicted HTH transcriptional regulator